MKSMMQIVHAYKVQLLPVLLKLYFPTCLKARTTAQHAGERKDAEDFWEQTGKGVWDFWKNTKGRFSL